MTLWPSRISNPRNHIHSQVLGIKSLTYLSWDTIQPTTVSIIGMIRIKISCLSWNVRMPVCTGLVCLRQWRTGAEWRWLHHPGHWHMALPSYQSSHAPHPNYPMTLPAWEAIQLRTIMVIHILGVFTFYIHEFKMKLQWPSQWKTMDTIFEKDTITYEYLHQL